MIFKYIGAKIVKWTNGIKLTPGTNLVTDNEAKAEMLRNNPLFQEITIKIKVKKQEKIETTKKKVNKGGKK